MATNHGQHAIVIGGSLAGLLTARVLSNHFDQVTIIERDKVNDQPECRKGQPQTRHLHGLLPNGLSVMKSYFPDLPESLREGGAIFIDMGTGLRWYVCGGYRLHFESGLVGCFVSRAFLEWKIRRRVMALSNVTVLDRCDVQGLRSSPGHSRVTGVRVIGRDGSDNAGETELPAELVVDAAGRGSATPKRLQTLGYASPEEEIVKVGVGYATRLYRRRPEDPDSGRGIMINAAPPRNRRSGFLFPLEGDRWVLTLAGHGGDHAPTEEDGFLEFAHSLAAPDIYDTMSHLEPLSDIFTHGFPSNLRRRYERLSRFPERYLVLGDAVCSFNPVYGQGMTSAALQAQALDETLTERSSLEGVRKPFFDKVGRIVDIAWMSAVGEDFRFPETEGRKRFGTDLVNAYVSRVQRATHKDPVVYRSFLEVINLMRPPTSLFRPQILWRVLRT
jgi:2-polyprenyl-6-methoxyphenol hydroxylase-like FAD-dependent oxidoreductase